MFCFAVKDEVKVTRVIRSCGWEVYKKNESYCYENDSDFKFEVNCQCFDEACNSGNKLINHMILPFVIIINFIVKICI